MEKAMTLHYIIQMAVSVILSHTQVFSRAVTNNQLFH